MIDGWFCDVGVGMPAADLFGGRCTHQPMKVLVKSSGDVNNGPKLLHKGVCWQ